LTTKWGGTLKQLPTGALDFAIITLILAFLLWAAATSHNSEALTPDRTWIVD
jgi:hypothetical protein